MIGERQARRVADVIGPIGRQQISGNHQVPNATIDRCRQAAAGNRPCPRQAHVHLLAIFCITHQSRKAGAKQTAELTGIENRITGKGRGGEHGRCRIDRKCLASGSPITGPIANAGAHHVLAISQAAEIEGWPTPVASR